MCKETTTILFKVGSAPCVLSTSVPPTATQIVCTLGAGAAGTVQAVVNVTGRGVSLGKTFTYQLVFTSILPTSGMLTIQKITLAKMNTRC